jgi:hypothetical protein
MADGTTFLAIAFIAMIGIIGGWTWKMLQRLNELSERLAAAEATYDHAGETGPAESSDSSEEE